MSGGRLIGIGVGPGDPELLTLKAVRQIALADVVAYVAAEGRASIARAIAAAHMRPGQHELMLELPMSKDAQPTDVARSTARTRLVDELERDRAVALLCEGDPMLYGSFLHLAGPLLGRFAVEIVPGVSSISAAAAAAQVPLARGDGPLHVLPATLDDATLARTLQLRDAAVILKVGRHLARLRALLDRLGLLEHATFVAHASAPRQRISKLAEVDEAHAPYFSLIIVQPGPWA